MLRIPDSRSGKGDGVEIPEINLMSWRWKSETANALRVPENRLSGERIVFEILRRFL